MNRLLRYLWFMLFAKPLVLLVMGVNVQSKKKLTSKQPAIIIANHNSHLDTLVLMTLFPLSLLRKIRPVAALDYFLKNRFLAWFALKIIGIIPLDRDVKLDKKDPLEGCSQALDRGEMLILFPEGTRGEPERIAQFKTGVAHLARRHPEVPIIPVFLHGLGKALPKGEFLLVPFFCDVIVGEPLYWTKSRSEFMDNIECCMKELAASLNSPPWE